MVKKTPDDKSKHILPALGQAKQNVVPVPGTPTPAGLDDIDIAPETGAPSQADSSKGMELDTSLDDLVGGVDNEDLDDIAKLAEGSGSDINLEGGSGSGGILDLDLEAHDSQIMEAIGPEIYPDLQKPRLSSKAKKAMSSLDGKIYHHDEIMGRMGFRKQGRWKKYVYTDGIRDIVFSKDGEGQPRVFIFYGYSLRKIVPAGSSMKALKTPKGKRAYHIFEQLAAYYFKSDGVKIEGKIPNNKYARVGFGYSVAYDPNDQKKLEETIRTIVSGGLEKYGNMKKAIEKYLGQNKLIDEIGGDAAFSLYRWGTALHRYRKNMATIKEAADLNEPPVAANQDSIAKAIAEISVQQAKKASPDRIPFYVKLVSYIPVLNRLGSRPKK